MEKLIYEEYAKYFIDKFAMIKGLNINKAWLNDEIVHITISTNLKYFNFFMGIYPYMIEFDGICICGEGLEFEDIETQDKKIIFEYIDEVSAKILEFIDLGRFIFAYKNNDCVFASAVDGVEIEKENNFDLKELYNKLKTKGDINFCDLDRIEIKDFYGDIIYEYNAPTKIK